MNHLLLEKHLWTTSDCNITAGVALHNLQKGREEYQTDQITRWIYKQPHFDTLPAAPSLCWGKDDSVYIITISC